MTNNQSSELFIQTLGTPRPQPRPRFFEGRVIANSNPNAQLWKRTLVASFLAHKQAQGWKQPQPDQSIAVAMVFMFATPDKSRWKTNHNHKPDTDNLAKLVLDVMTQVGIIEDDCIVSRLMVEKRWCKEGDEGLLMSVCSLAGGKGRKKIKKDS